jgi:hypothetical protein
MTWGRGFTFGNFARKVVRHSNHADVLYVRMSEKMAFELCRVYEADNVSTT